MHHRTRPTLAAMAVALLLTAPACTKKTDGTSTSGGSASGRVVVSGSSTVEPISSGVAEMFQEQNGDVDISVDGPGTGDGFKLFCAGDADIADASRPIKPEEIADCEANHIEFVELEIALDGLTVIANKDSGVECLSFADLYALIGPEAKGFDRWTDAQDLAEELGSDTRFPDRPLDITGPGEESGTYDSFIEIALQDIGEARADEGELGDADEAETTRPDYQASSNDNAIVQGVEGSEGGLGWVGFAYAEQQGDTLLEVGIAKEPGQDCVVPTTETIKDGRYPLSRSLYIYVAAAQAEAGSAVAAYVDLYLDGLGDFVEQAGYTPLTGADASATKLVWEARTVGTRNG